MSRVLERPAAPQCAVQGGVISMTPSGKLLSFLAGVLVIVALAVGGMGLYRAGHADAGPGRPSGGDSVARFATARAKAEQEARKEEARRQAEIDEVRDHAQAETALALAGCANKPDVWQPEPANAPAIPVRPKEARQSDSLQWCSPTCSAGLTKERVNWQRRMTELEYQD